MSTRSVIFWIHLLAGLTAGAVIFVMSVTGIAIAFEEEILEWQDRKVSRINITGPPPADPPLAIDELTRRIQQQDPGFHIASVAVFRDPLRAWAFYSEEGALLHVNPHTGATRESQAHEVHEVIHKLEEWHRWLGASDGLTSSGRLVTGVCNLAFLVLCVTGLYLWFPRGWSWRSLRPLLILKRGARGKARDYNWHAVFGFWSLPVLLVLSASAVVISFEWGHRLVFTMAGEEAPQSRGYGMMAVPAPVVPTPPQNAQPLPLEQVIDQVASAFPAWDSITLEDLTPQTGAPQPLEIGVTVPYFMPSRAYIPVKSDPYTGAILQAVHFEERSAGLQARIWIRFLHTGSAFGLPGKVIACLATTAALILVWTGFSLSWRRYVAWAGRARRATSA